MLEQRVRVAEGRGKVTSRWQTARGTDLSRDSNRQALGCEPDFCIRLMLLLLLLVECSKTKNLKGYNVEPKRDILRRSPATDEPHSFPAVK